MQRTAEPVNFFGANAFAALDTKKSKKKKSGKDKDEKSKKPAKASTSQSNGFATTPPVAEGQVFASTNWADDSDDDDFAMAPMANWVQEHVEDEAAAAAAKEEKADAEEAELEVDIEAELGIELADDDDDEDEDSEIVSNVQSRNVSEMAPSTSQAAEPKEEERQLSKKEIKKREMAEMAAVMAELGIASDKVSDEAVPADATTKKKAKKKKATKEELAAAAAAAAAAKEAEATAQETAEPVELVDPAVAKRKLAAMASSKGKTKASVSKTAADEAKLRAKKAAAGGGKAKKANYNQAPR